MLRILFDDNMTLLKEANEINRNIASSLEILANKIPSNDETDSFNTVIATKLDNLVAAISNSNSALVSQHAPAPVQQNIQKELKERATLFEKRVHSEKLCELYTELLNDVVPFAPNQLRAHVSPTAKDFEKKIKQKGTIFNVNNQIEIMQGHITDWTERISAIDEEISAFLATREEKREGTNRQIHIDEEKAKKSVNEVTIPKLRRTYDREKQADPTADFLLNTQESPRNSRGQSRGSRRRRWKNPPS